MKFFLYFVPNSNYIPQGVTEPMDIIRR